MKFYLILIFYLGLTAQFNLAAQNEINGAKGFNYNLIHQYNDSESKSELRLYEVKRNNVLINYSAFILMHEHNNPQAPHWLGGGVLVLAIPENVNVKYNSIAIRMAKSLDTKEYKKYRANKKAEEVAEDITDILGLLPVFSEIFLISKMLGIKAGNNYNVDNRLDLNNYDLIYCPWDAAMRDYKKIRIDIPVENTRSQRVALFANWTTTGINAIRGGNTYSRNVRHEPGLNLNKNQ